MTSSSSSFGSFGGQWTAQKLAALEEYFAAYNTVLSKWPFKRIYIDGFAGGGRVPSEKIKCAAAPSGPNLFNDGLVQPSHDDLSLSENEVEESEEYRHGSPLIALKTVPEFHEFIFIEREFETIRQLEKQVRADPALNGRQVKFLCEDANTAITRICKQEWSRKLRATIFLDPFALNVRWSTIEAIASTKGMDMWLLFPAMAVNRMLPRNTEIPAAWGKKLTETFGDDTWAEEFYAEREPFYQYELFSEEPAPAKRRKLADPFGRLSRYVTRRLKTIFADAIDEPLVLKTASGSPLFLLCFAVANQSGAAIAKRIASHIVGKQKHGH